MLTLGRNPEARLRPDDVGGGIFLYNQLLGCGSARNDWNAEHVLGHGVELEEAEDVVEEAAAPYPLWRPDDKWLGWGRGVGDRLLQVVFVLDEDDSVYVIHARPLTDREKRRYRRKR